MIIKLVRHGQSKANAEGYDNAKVAEYTIPLTDLGKEQATETGKLIGRRFMQESLVYTSPYLRAVQTLDNLLIGAGIGVYVNKVYQDPRLREVDHGYASFEEQQELFNTHGQFFYRFKGGESPADCFDRVSTFLESLRRQSDRKGCKSALIVAHGLTIRCFVMRFLHLTVEQYDQMKNPRNASIITIAKKDQLENPVFTCGSWGVEGLVLKND